MSALDWDKARRHRLNQADALPDPQWWWIHLARSQGCAQCGGDMKRGDAVAYCHELRQRVCKSCAEELGLAPRESRRFVEGEALGAKARPRAARTRKRFYR